MPTDTFIKPTENARRKIQSFAFVSAVVIGVLLSLFFLSPYLCRDESSPRIELDTRLNPNYAPLASLLRLPGLGAIRAAAVVAYREDFGKRNPGSLAFDDCGDLAKVKGLGPKTVAGICVSLKFDSHSQ